MSSLGCEGVVLCYLVIRIRRERERGSGHASRRMFHVITCLMGRIVLCGIRHLRTKNVGKMIIRCIIISTWRLNANLSGYCYARCCVGPSLAGVLPHLCQPTPGVNVMPDESSSWAWAGTGA